MPEAVLFLSFSTSGSSRHNKLQVSECELTERHLQAFRRKIYDCLWYAAQWAAQQGPPFVAAFRWTDCSFWPVLHVTRNRPSLKIRACADFELKIAPIRVEVTSTDVVCGDFNVLQTSIPISWERS